MSARNYKSCPRCIDRAAKRKKAAYAKVHAEYGKVSEEKYEQLMEQAQSCMVLTDSLGEHYEMLFDAGKFHFSYSCHCDECGFSFKHKSETPVSF